MTAQNLTNAVSERICKHMNQDHKKAISGYAVNFGGCKNPINVTMLSINTRSMKLLADEETLEIFFDHELKDSEDAHKTLVAMSKQSKEQA